LAQFFRTGQPPAAIAYRLGFSLDASGNVFLAGGGGLDVLTPQSPVKLDFCEKVAQRV
jgi:hypothetical protein